MPPNQSHRCVNSLDFTRTLRHVNDTKQFQPPLSGDGTPHCISSKMKLLYARWVALVFAIVASPTHAAEANQANQAELEMTEGIGPQMSELILAQRNLHPFTDWKDFIDRIKGVGSAKAIRLSEAGLTVNGQAFALDLQKQDRKQRTPSGASQTIKAPKGTYSRDDAVDSP
jgi:competence protein ComEA